MISHLHLRCGASAGATPLVVVTPPSVTIFVGPNNSGKSQALREIANYFGIGQRGAFGKLLEKMTFINQTPLLSREDFRTITEKGDPHRDTYLREITMRSDDRYEFTNAEHRRLLSNPNDNPGDYAQLYARHFTSVLDGANRIALLNSQPRGDLKNPTTKFASILMNDKKRSSLRRLIHDAFGLFFAIDCSVGDQLHIRFGLSEPPDERSFHDINIDYMRRAADIEAVSDGVKAYTGVLLQVHVGSPKVIIIDEPEAFLHPSLAFKLGKELAKGAATEGKHVFAATHSPEFVMGATLSGAKINIIRLTYAGGIGTARLLPSAGLTKLMQDPLLRSVGVIAGLFYDYVAVGEADADRAFYQEINERLTAADDPRGIPHALFLNADNKQTIPRIIEPLRRLGIPACGIADIDIVKEGGDVWTRHLEACNIPTSDHQPYGTRRANTLRALESKEANFKASGGINLLSGAEREAADVLFDDLARYGLFVVRHGEVENWLSSLDVPRAKHSWLRSIFEKMGSDPNSPGYVKPSPGDVWEFVGKVRAWLVNPQHRGIPP